jgi:hypothetical protein
VLNADAPGNNRRLPCFFVKMPAVTFDGHSLRKCQPQDVVCVLLNSSQR